MYTIIYFSPTGNVKHLAKKLAANLEVPKSNIQPLEFTDVNELKRNKHLVLLYPVHAFNAPRTVKRFVRDLPSGLYDDVSLLSVGSSTVWLNKAVSSDLRKVLTKKNYSIIVDEVLAMPLTLIVSFPDELSKKIIAESEQRIGEISSNIINGVKSISEVEVKSHLANFFGKAETYAARLFGLELHANNNCTSCGICWDNCPENNIAKNSKDKPKFAFDCIMCMRCIYDCPEKSISPRFSKFIPIKKGYSFKDFEKMD